MATESVVMMPEVGEQLPGRRRGRGKQHICPEQGCKKTFSRAEHLQRHALNHTPQDLTCNLCSTGFKRKDLLGKHYLPWCSSSFGFRDLDLSSNDDKAQLLRNVITLPLDIWF